MDSQYFSSLPPGTLDPGLKVPQEILDMLHSNDEIQALCIKYFASVHIWLPMLSKKRLYSKVLCYNPATDATLSLLLLCMRLSTTVPALKDEARTCPLYWTVKQFYSTLESSGVVSLHLIQSSLLIAVYEIGHGLFPAGYFSVSNAARMGMMMGLHDRKHATQLLKPADTWTLREEERRTWWAVFILDRHVNDIFTSLPH